MLFVALLTICVPIFLTYTLPIVNNFNSEINTENYIKNNVKCAVFLIDFNWKYNPEPVNFIYKHKLVIYIINNGSKNIDSPLQLNIDCSQNQKFNIAKPEGNLNLSYFQNTIKPWIFGDDYSVSIRWNNSYAGSPLPKKSSRWAIINCYSNDYLYCNEFDILNFTVTINDEFDVKITEFSCNFKSPSGHPKDWNISEIIQDIEWYG